MSGPEDWLAEQPCVSYLLSLGYEHLAPEWNGAARESQNMVILRDVCIEALMRLNDITEADARAVYQDLKNQTDNEVWFKWLRGGYSRKVEGQTENKTIHFIDYVNVERNTFTVTNQFTVEAQNKRIPDIAVFINGIPVVVIEAKNPVSYKQKATEAYEQIRQYQDDIPRLFYSNAFNIITDGQFLLYGATGAKADYWGQWKDPWPRKREEFSDDFKRGLWALLEPSRLLDLIAHFIVFERRDGNVIKKICRYQQFRAVNKMVERVVEDKYRKGLVWHTQGSGKSLTMVMAALKLKKHLTIPDSKLGNPNLLVLTDRKDLDEQIAGTFIACGLSNPRQVEGKADLRNSLSHATKGLTLLSTIFKFEGLKTPVADSANWIVLVDECHRTQEKDLAAYMRATLPDARFYGFTGTPVKANDKNTYENFSPVGEAYLDKYGIDDAVADGATIPIKYMSRMAEWHLDPKKLDVVFDQEFVNESEEQLEKIKKNGVGFADLVKHPERIKLLAFDMWTHFKGHAMPDGFKAQVVAIDREAIILYKRALDEIITEDLMIRKGMAPEEAATVAASYSECVYSSSQEDAKPCDDEWKESIRKDLVRYALPRTTPEKRDEPEVRSAFGKLGEPPHFLIVCSKLLTGFDAPVESVMYLDNPLKEHNLLQAIARTNRVYGDKKQYGLIVDYIGVTKKLNEALESYRSEDVEHAMVDIDSLRDELRAAHAVIADVLSQHNNGADYKEALRDEFNALIQAIGTEDAWFIFSKQAKAFIHAYEALSPDPYVLEFTRDMKWVAMFLPYATRHFEQRKDTSLKDYSAKIREILEEHLDVTGVRTLIKLRTLTDPEYWKDFETEGRQEADLKEAAIRKATELKRVLSEKVRENELQFMPFSKRVQEIIKRMSEGQVDFAEELRKLEKLSHDLQDEIKPKGALEERAHGIYKILDAFMAKAEVDVDGSGKGESTEGAEQAEQTLNALQELALDIHELYSSDITAPVGWHMKEQLKKNLRMEVVRMLKGAGLMHLWKEVPPKVEAYAEKKYLKL